MCNGAYVGVLWVSCFRQIRITKRWYQTTNQLCYLYSDTFRTARNIECAMLRIDLPKNCVWRVTILVRSKAANPKNWPRVPKGNIHRILTYFISLIWLINGLLCKVLNLVPRHQQIVSRILGAGESRLLTILIGLSEIVMALWVFSRARQRLCAITQITVIGTMNVLEFILAPDLLLWGRFNSLFALLFVLLIYFNEFILNKKLHQP